MAILALTVPADQSLCTLILATARGTRLNGGHAVPGIASKPADGTLINAGVIPMIAAFTLVPGPRGSARAVEGTRIILTGQAQVAHRVGSQGIPTWLVEAHEGPCIQVDTVAAGFAQLRVSVAPTAWTTILFVIRARVSGGAFFSKTRYTFRGKRLASEPAVSPRHAAIPTGFAAITNEVSARLAGMTYTQAFPRAVLVACMAGCAAVGAQVSGIGTDGTFVSGFDKSAGERSVLTGTASAIRTRARLGAALVRSSASISPGQAAHHHLLAPVKLDAKPFRLTLFAVLAESVAIPGTVQFNIPRGVLATEEWRDQLVVPAGSRNTICSGRGVKTGQVGVLGSLVVLVQPIAFAILRGQAVRQGPASIHAVTRGHATGQGVALEGGLRLAHGQEVLVRMG